MSAPAAPAIAVVVPVRHDTEALATWLARPRAAAVHWVVVNGDAADRSLDALRAAHADVVWVEGPPGRGSQVAAGVAVLDASVAWVLVCHADTRLPTGWQADVTRAASRASYHWGCFRLGLDSSAWQARVIERAVRLRVRCLRLPYGDQAMFFRRATLDAVGGVPRVPLMEDVLLARRFASVGPPWRSRLVAVTSARRWEREGWFRRSARNLWLLSQFLLGVSPDRLARAYRSNGTTPC